LLLPVFFEGGAVGRIAARAVPVGPDGKAGGRREVARSRVR